MQYKLNKKLIAIDLTLICLAISGIVYAGYWINSIVYVTVSQYTITLTATPQSVNQYENVTFTASLDKDGMPAPNELIHFYQGEAELGTSMTGLDGIAVFVWNMTNPGTIEFKASFWVP